MTTQATPITVRSNSANKIFNSVTHPTSVGTSRLSFITKRKFVAAEMILLLGILQEEFESSFKSSDVHLTSWQTEQPVTIRQRAPSFIDEEELPPPAPALICEFNLLTGWVSPPNKHRYFAVVFHGLTYSYQKPKVHYVQQEFGRSVEETGVRRIPVQYQGTGNRDCENKKRQAGRIT